MTNPKPEIERFPEGTRVRVTERSASGDSDMDDSAGRVGGEYDVCYPVAADAKGNDDPLGKAYLLLDDEGSYGGSHWAYPEHVTVVMTTEQKASRAAPSVEQIRNGVASALMSMHDPIEPDEADYASEAEVHVTGRTADGLRVSFRVRVDQVEEVDW